MLDAQLLDDYIEQHDVEAFEALVRRHGPLVSRVCRDVLGDLDEAEDAFQATFLVLVRRAGTIRDPDSVGRWLHGVATRIAVRARADACRRRLRERGGMVMETRAEASDHDEVAAQELRPVIHTELDRLPAKLRAPLILCYLEELTYEEAARRLRLPLGTLKARLSKGRELLRSRLARRGFAVSMAILLALLGERARAVPPDLIGATVNAGALLDRRSRAIPPTIPNAVVSLVEGELAAGTFRRMASMLGLALVLGIVGTFLSLAVSEAMPTIVGCFEDAGGPCLSSYAER